MKILWLCNVMLPVIAGQLGIEASNKEGWISGLADVLLKRRQENGVELAVAFPAPASLMEAGRRYVKKTVPVEGYELTCYGFAEDTLAADVYDSALEQVMSEIARDCQPDVVHCFGTEYPHTLAMCRTFPDKSRLLITIQGLCSVYANVFYADLPEEVIRSVTFRDLIKKDTLPRQKEKFVKRGEMEIEALKLAGNAGGRTPWDLHYAREWNGDIRYFEMNETLRREFYEGGWIRERCVPHSIFLSQGDYPIKGLHYMLKALPEILAKYPDTTVAVAGNSLVGYRTLKEKIKISAYGKYLRKLIAELHLEGKVTFLGKLTAGQMKEQYLKSHLFVCPSSIENSPNSLGEAMLLGMPCVSADVGGVRGIFTDGEDGILYRGCKSDKNSFDDLSDGASSLDSVAHNLAEAVLLMWSDAQKEKEYCQNAREHARRNHDRDRNYRLTVEVYRTISEAAEGR